MKFRQRFAWILLFLYLFLSLVIVYYCFELNDQYSTLALEHTKLHHSDNDKEENSSWAIHLPDVPFILWMLLFAIPYLQVFFCLYVCTKPEPKDMLCYVPFFMCFRRSPDTNGKPIIIEKC